MEICCINPENDYLKNKSNDYYFRVHLKKNATSLSNETTLKVAEIRLKLSNLKKTFLYTNILKPQDLTTVRSHLKKR